VYNLQYTLKKLQLWIVQSIIFFPAHLLLRIIQSVIIIFFNESRILQSLASLKSEFPYLLIVQSTIVIFFNELQIVQSASLKIMISDLQIL